MNDQPLTDYQRANLSLWSRTQMVEFLMREGLRRPRSKLRRRPTEWLMRECITEGALQCHECGEETNHDNPMLETGVCEQCQVKVDESYHDEATCDCPCHD